MGSVYEAKSFHKFNGAAQGFGIDFFRVASKNK